MKKIPTSHIYSLIFAILVIVNTPSGADTLTFDNDGGDNLFSTSANWDPDTVLTGFNNNLSDDFIIGSAFNVTNNPSGITWTTLGVGSLTIDGSLNSQWLGRVPVDLRGTLSLRGGNEPLPFGTTVNLTTNNATINFLAENVADATSEHLSKISVNGEAAVVGTNVNIVSDGAAGSILTVIAAADPLAFQFDIDTSGSNLVFTWDSQSGKVYDLLTSTDPEADGDPDTWTIVTSQENIAADPPTNTLTITRPVDGTRFYAIREENAPPPLPVFSDDFESDNGWETGVGGSHTGNTGWELGPPDVNFVDGPDSGANGSANCYGSDLDNYYEAGTDTWLRSPPINLTGATGATLSFWHIFDVEGSGDETAVVRVLRSSDNSVLGEVETFGTFDLNLLDWFEFSETLPPAALGETIRLEFQLTVDSGAGQLFPGWYIDDVAVRVDD